MDIYGIGTDIVECVRIRRMVEKHGEHFLRRVYTEREITYCQSRKRAMEHFAGRWAAKEAIFKALGTGWAKGLTWTDLEVRHDASGKPMVLVAGAVRDFVKSRKIAEILLSISHCRTYATAYALALRKSKKSADPSDTV